MSRRQILALVCSLSAVLFPTQATSARPSIKVNEAEPGCLLKQLAPEFSLAIVISEPTVDVAIIELIGRDDKVVSVTERRLLQPGGARRNSNGNISRQVTI